MGCKLNHILKLCVGMGFIFLVACGKEQNINHKYSENFADYAQLELTALEKYAAQKDPLAQTQLALYHAMALGGVEEKNPQKSMQLLVEAADKGEIEAIYQLSEMYITPHLSGVEDREKSKQLLRQAAEAGHATAQMMLATRLQFGGYEHERNLEQAIYWFEQAIENGHEGAKMQLENLKKINSQP